MTVDALASVLRGTRHSFTQVRGTIVPAADAPGLPASHLWFVFVNWRAVICFCLLHSMPVRGWWCRCLYRLGFHLLGNLHRHGDGKRGLNISWGDLGVFEDAWAGVLHDPLFEKEYGDKREDDSGGNNLP